MAVPFSQISIDHDTVSQSKLNIDYKVRSNLFAWNGQFSPQFIEALLDNFSKETDIVFDPFLGSGTTLYESGRKQLPAFGIELNASAYFMAKVYELINLDLAKRNDVVNEVESVLSLIKGDNDIVDVITTYIHEHADSYASNLLSTLIILLDAYKNKLSIELMTKKWDGLKDTVLKLPDSSGSIVAYMGDARSIPKEDNSATLLITSPPYINVFNYHQKYRRSVELLGYNVLATAKTEFGSNRKHRGNRLLTVIQYCIDMALSIKEACRICALDSRMIYVVGRESDVLGYSFCNSQLIYEICTEVFDLPFLLRQERVFKNRFGTMIYEDILHFSCTKSSTMLEEDVVIDKARKIAIRMLEEKKKSCPENKNNLFLDDAIAKAFQVKKSECIKTPRGTHGEKVVAARESDKLPVEDRKRLDEAISRYDKWIQDIESVEGETLDELIDKMVALLNEYKYYLDVNVIFDSTKDFLYRQKGQLKLDSTVMEEFLPIFVRKCLVKEFGQCDLIIGSQTATFSSAYFASSLSNPGIGGEINIKTKDQDFSMSRPLYLRSSYTKDFSADSTKEVKTHLGYIMAELKTNLDKTMFQEASATAHDVKLAVTGAKYYLLCDFLDMPPISTTTTDIDEILIVRKAKRISSNIRKSFSTYAGRQLNRKWYTDYLKTNPYAPDMFKRFIEHIIYQMKNEGLTEEAVLKMGYF